MQLAKRPASLRSATSIDVVVGQRIRLRRTILGLKQDELAEAVGLSYQQLQKYERGQSRISASRLSDVARVLDAPLSWFLENDHADGGAAPSLPLSIDDFASASNHASKRSFGISRETLEVVRMFEGLPSAGHRAMVLKVIRVIAAGTT